MANKGTENLKQVHETEIPKTITIGDFDLENEPDCIPLAKGKSSKNATTLRWILEMATYV